MMQDLLPLEKTLLKELFSKYPSLEPHESAIRVSKRSTRKNVLLIEFDYFADETTNFDTWLNALFSNDFKIVIPELKKGLAYVIDVTAGEITSLELMSYDETWDGSYSDFELVQKEESKI